jgi:hypothetical protein
MIDETEHSLGIPGFAYLGRPGCMAPDSGSRLHMAPYGPAGALLVDSDHGYRILRRNCWVHSQPQLPGAWDRDRNKTAAGADQAGSPPASTPLQSPHFLVVAKQADCAVYGTRNAL